MKIQFEKLYHALEFIEEEDLFLELLGVAILEKIGFTNFQTFSSEDERVEEG